MSRKTIDLILFYLFAISCTIIVRGLTFEGVHGSGKGKAPDDGEDTNELSRRWFKANAKQTKGESSASVVLNETKVSLGSDKEIQLGDELDNICQNLLIQDLMNFRAVCKDWRIVASREILNRGIEGAVLPHIYSTEILNVDANFHVTHVLRSKPYVALLFISPTGRERYYPQSENLEYEVLDMYRRYFPQYLVTLGVDRTMMDNHIINSSPSLSDQPNGILGLFVPLHSSLHVKVSRCTVERFFELKACVEHIIDAVKPIPTSTKTMLIMLASTDFGIFVSRLVLASIKQRYEQKKFTLWGGLVNVLKTSESTIEHQFDRNSEIFFAMKITGSNLNSWSTIIDCTLPKHDVDQQLLELRNNIKIKRHTLGLVYGPQYVQDRYRNSFPNAYKDNIEIMEAVKKVFPEIPFESIFTNIDHYSNIYLRIYESQRGYINHTSFGVNSMIDDNNQQLYGRLSLSLLILTHD